MCNLGTCSILYRIHPLFWKIESSASIRHYVLYFFYAKLKTIDLLTRLAALCSPNLISLQNQTKFPKGRPSSGQLGTLLRQAREEVEGEQRVALDTPGRALVLTLALHLPLDHGSPGHRGQEQHGGQQQQQADKHLEHTEVNIRQVDN